MASDYNNLADFSYLAVALFLLIVFRLSLANLSAFSCSAATHSPWTFLQCFLAAVQPHQLSLVLSSQRSSRGKSAQHRTNALNIFTEAS